MKLHARRIQRVFKRSGKRVVAQAQQHLGRGAARTGTGHRLVGSLAAGKGLEIKTQNRLARCRNVVGTHDKIKVGGTGNKYHQIFRN